MRIHALDNDVDDTSAPARRRRARHGGVGRGVRLAPDRAREPARRHRRRPWPRAERRAGAGLPVGRPLRRSRGDGGGACASTGRCFVAFSRGSSYAMGYALAHPHGVRGLVIGDYWARHVGLPPEFGERQLAVVLRGVPMSERMPAHAVHGVARESREVPLWDRRARARVPGARDPRWPRGVIVTDELAAQWEAALPERRVRDAARTPATISGVATRTRTSRCSARSSTGST